jgi:uncharacterized protein (UPF0261 family)
LSYEPRPCCKRPHFFGLQQGIKLESEGNVVNRSTVLVIGTADTKAEEMQFLRSCIEKIGVKAVMMDVGVLHGAAFPVEITHDDVAAAAGVTIADVIATGEENSAMQLMSKGAGNLARKLYENGEIGGMIALGGSMGTDLALDVANVLPLGVPKFVISTIAFSPLIPAERLSPDLMMILWAGGLYGLNSVCRSVLSQAAGAVAGAIKAVEPPQKSKPMIGMSGLGTSCLNYTATLVPALAERGYEVAVFHATGMGGRALDNLTDQNQFVAVLDFAVSEISNAVHGGACSAGEDRGEAAGRQGIPLIFAPGASDMVDLATWQAIPERFVTRDYHAHNRLIASIAQTPGERIETAKSIASKLGKARGPVIFILPKKGIQAWDREGQPMHDVGAMNAFARAFRDHMPPNVDMREIDAHICDKEFCNLVLDIVDQWVAEGVIPAGSTDG